MGHNIGLRSNSSIIMFGRVMTTAVRRTATYTTQSAQRRTMATVTSNEGPSVLPLVGVSGATGLLMVALGFDWFGKDPEEYMCNTEKIVKEQRRRIYVASKEDGEA